MISAFEERVHVAEERIQAPFVRRAVEIVTRLEGTYFVTPAASLFQLLENTAEIPQASINSRPSGPGADFVRWPRL